MTLKKIKTTNSVEEENVTDDILVTEAEVLGSEQPKEEESPKMVTMSIDEIDALLEKKLKERESKDVKSPKTAEQKQEVIIKNENFDDIPELRNFDLKERIYVLADGTKPLSQEIRARHKDYSPLMYLNKETKEQFSLFYSDTQTSFFKEKHKGDSKVTHILMKDGMLKTRQDQVKLQKFLEIHPDNVANGGSLFELYNPSKEAEEKLNQEDLIIDAQILNRGLTFLQRNAVARLMCSNYKDTWEPAELKHALNIELKKNPSKFIKLANDKTLEVKGIAKTAVNQGLLIYRNRKFFNEEEDFLCELKANDQDEWSVIASYLLSAEGNNTYEYIKNAVS